MENNSIPIEEEDMKTLIDELIQGSNNDFLPEPEIPSVEQLFDYIKNLTKEIDTQNSVIHQQKKYQETLETRIEILEKKISKMGQLFTISE